MSKQATRPSEELLALREQTVANGTVWFANYGQLGLGNDAYWAIRRLIECSVGDWTLCRTHLEVVELIERAAVAAQKEEEGR